MRIAPRVGSSELDLLRESGQAFVEVDEVVAHRLDLVGSTRVFGSVSSTLERLAVVPRTDVTMFREAAQMAGSRKHKPQEVRRLVERFVEVFLAPDEAEFSDLAQPLLARAPGHLRPGEDVYLNVGGFEPSYSIMRFATRHEACRDLADHIFEVIPEEWQYVEAHEIWDALWVPLEEMFPSGGSREGAVKPIADQLLVRLGTPPKRWAFAAQIGEVHPNYWEPAIKFDGEEDLELYTEASRDVPDLLCLRGGVRAHTMTGALWRIEKIAMSVLGASLAVGIIENDPERPSVKETHRFGVRLNEEDARFTSGTQGILSGCWTSVPRDLSELERAALQQGRIDRVIERRVRVLQLAIAAKGRRAEEVRNSCRVALTAAATSDYGLSLTLAFSVVEGLLLEADQKDNVLARLTEAVAHTLGNTADDRRRLRDAAKRLYDHRSTFVHTGHVDEAARGRRHAMELMFAVLRRELESLR